MSISKLVYFFLLNGKNVTNAVNSAHDTRQISSENQYGGYTNPKESLNPIGCNPLMPSIEKIYHEHK